MVSVTNQEAFLFSLRLWKPHNLSLEMTFYKNLLQYVLLASISVGKYNIPLFRRHFMNNSSARYRPKTALTNEAP